MRINVAYSTDDNYATFTGISIYSLCANNTSIADIVIHIVENNISEKNIEKLKKTASEFNRIIIFYDCNNLFMELQEKFRLTGEQTIATYGRMFLSQIVDVSIEKILYIDSDTLILGDISELFIKDISKNYVLGVLDTISGDDKLIINLKKDDFYINAGITLFNLKSIRDSEMENNYNDYIKNIMPFAKHNDQDMINNIFHEGMGILNPKYNVMTFIFEKKYSDIKKLWQLNKYYSRKEIEESKYDPVIVHFTPSYSNRPWVKNSKHPLKKKWDEYKSKTEWYDVIDLEDSRSLKMKILSIMYRYMPIYLYKSVINTYLYICKK